YESRKLNTRVSVVKPMVSHSSANYNKKQSASSVRDYMIQEYALRNSRRHPYAQIIKAHIQPTILSAQPFLPT
ncbi:unnamed protein product, partial [Heterotrigona itama]